MRLPPVAAALLLALALATVGSAQHAAVCGQLAADHERRGPPAWTWFRAELLPRLPGWVQDRDPFAGVVFRWSNDSWQFEDLAEPLAGDAYLRAQVDLGDGEFTGSCDHAGHARWRATSSAMPRLLTALPPAARRNTLEVDVGIAVGLLSAGVDDDDRLGRRWLQAAAECGTLATVVAPSGEVFAHSAGGMTLPLLLALRTRGTSASMPEGLERWTFWARSGKGATAEQATRQLAASTDPRASRRLASLLGRSDAGLAVTMDAAIRHGGAAALAGVLEVPPSAHRWSPQLAGVAVARLWPQQLPATRAQLLLHHGEHPAVRRHLAAAPWSLAGIALLTLGFAVALFARRL